MPYRKVSVIECAKSIKDAWQPVNLVSLENYLVKSVIFEKEYYKHYHPNHDEFIYVQNGEISIEFEDSELHLKEGEGVLIEKGTVHKSKSKTRSTVLLFESSEITTEFKVGGLNERRR